MNKSELMQIPLSHFGLPNVRKFPMPDEKRLKAAISYFYTASEKDRKELADNIIRRHKELDSNIRVSSKNPLYTYVPDSLKKDESDKPLISEDAIAPLLPLLDDESTRIVESLMQKDGLDTVDDLDSAVPDEYKNKERLLGTLKSFIINGSSDEGPYDYPLAYTDFPVTTNKLSSNNGGILTTENFSILRYDQSLNECASVDVVKNVDHIRFGAVLREWNELYVAGHRNFEYDRLMIEAWKTAVNDLAVSHIESPTPHSTQKFIDLGITGSVLSIDGHMNSFIFDVDDKFKEIGIPNGAEVISRRNPRTNTITISALVGTDGEMIQKGRDRDDESEIFKP